MSRSDAMSGEVLSAEEKLLCAIFGVSHEKALADKERELTPKEEVARKQKLRQKIDGVLKLLTIREREIIKLRFGLSDGYDYTLEEVGRLFRVPRERICQIETKAFRKIQDASNGGEENRDE